MGEDAGERPNNVQAAMGPAAPVGQMLHWKHGSGRWGGGVRLPGDSCPGCLHPEQGISEVS